MFKIFDCHCQYSFQCSKTNGETVTVNVLDWVKKNVSYVYRVSGADPVHRRGYRRDEGNKFAI